MRAEHSVHQEILWEDQFDWRFKRFGHGDHHVGTEHPEDIVDEQTAEQNAAVQHGVEVQQFDTVNREGQTEHIVGDPVLLPQVPAAEQGGEDEREQIDGGELEIDQTVAILVGALRELKRVGLHERRWDDLMQGRWQYMCQRKYAKNEEVECQEKIYILLWEDLDRGEEKSGWVILNTQDKIDD